MSTATLAPPVPPPARATGTVVLPGLDWTTYTKLLDAFGDRRFRHTYDRGRLEIMPPLLNHDDSVELFRLVVLVLAGEYGYKLKSVGSTTLRREDLDRGLEPDRAFYLQRMEAMRGVRDLDLTVHPPPDLAVEVDVTHLSLDRLPVYAALGVPEVWRYRRGVLEVRAINPDGTYRLVPDSPTFPKLPLDGIAGWAGRVAEFDDFEFMDQFRAWVRQQRGPQP